MFRKILLQFFPQEETTNKLSPINFHLKLLIPRLFYGLSLKYSLEARRLYFTDARLSYFFPADIIIKDYKDEKFFYSYKDFALLNWFDNYGLNINLFAVSLIAFTRYFSYLPDNKNFSLYLKLILFSFHYVLLLFFTHFKEYNLDLTKDERVKFLLNLLEDIITYLQISYWEKNIKLINKHTKNIIEIIKMDYEFLMFLYNLTEELAAFFENFDIHHFDYYRYLVTWMLMDFPNESEFYGILDQTIKKIFIKRYVSYIDADIMSFCNVLFPDVIHIVFITNNNNYEFLPYLSESLDYILDIDLLNLPIKQVIDKVLDIKTWSKTLIKALKDFNSDNIDITISPDMSFQQVQDLLSKEMMDSVKKISAVNEQLLDILILLISKRFNNEGFSFQYPLFSYDKVSDLPEENLKENYIFLDENYFKQSYFYRNKKKIDKPKRFYQFYDKVWEKLIFSQHLNILLEDFNKKTLKLYFPGKIYENLLKEIFYDDIKELISKNWYEKYLILLGLDAKSFKFTSEQIKNFRENIYYPDFIVFYRYLKHLREKINRLPIKKKSYFISLGLIKKSLFGAKIYESIIWQSSITNTYWKSALFPWSYIEDLDIALDSFYLPEKFLTFFSKVKQNKKFAEIINKLFPSLPDLHKKWFVMDCLKDITSYNKRTFKI